MGGFCDKYRPSGLKAVVGQSEACKVLRGFMKAAKVPHTLLLTGPSGCGKTTLARIVAEFLTGGIPSNLFEINSANFRGIETVRDVSSKVGLRAFGGKARVWIIDECHQMTKDAQNALLKVLEDTPGHVYFMLLTTDSAKLLPTIKTRCTEVRVKGLSDKDMKALLEGVCESEEEEVEESVLDRIIEVAEGSARKALKILEAAVVVEGEEPRLESVYANDSRRQAIDLARALIAPRARWADVAVVLRGLDEDPEGLRKMVLAYCASVLLGGGKLAPRASLIIEEFRDNFYDGGRAALVSACWRVCGGGQ
jgi:DNA polymerase-3 subunit gamma/tau